MITEWLLYSAIVGALLTVAAETADRLLRGLGRQSRWVWAAALAATAAWPLAAFAWQSASDSRGVASPLAASLQAATALATSASEQTLRVSLDTLVLATWIIASAVLALKLARSLRQLAVRRRTWRTETVDGVAVRISDNVGPALVGFRKPEIVLPDWALMLDSPLRAIVLHHEQEHQRAGDPWLLTFAALLVVAAPWHPALWWQSRRLRLAIELDCDARVLRTVREPERYGLLLLSIAQRRSAAHPRVAAALIEPVNHLERRINAMTRKPSLTRPRAALLTAVAAGAVVLACDVDSPPEPVGAAPARADTALIVEGASSAPGPVVERGTVQLPVIEQGTVKQGTAELRKTAKEPVRELPAVPDSLSTKYTQHHPVLEAARMAEVRRQDEARMSDTAAAHWEFQVERPAQWIAGTGAPRYPDVLRSAGVSGTVLAQFVVTADGRADLGSLRILRSTHDQFSNAVRSALPGMRFTPAQAAGRTVKQLLQQEFSFQVQ